MHIMLDIAGDYVILWDIS